MSPNFGDGGWHHTPGCENIDWHNVQPLKDRAVVELIPDSYESMIALPEIGDADESVRFAKVLAVGTGTRETVHGELRECCCIRPGDVVMIGPWQDMLSQDGCFAIIQEEDVRLIGRDLKLSAQQMVRRMKEFVKNGDLKRAS